MTPGSGSTSAAALALPASSTSTRVSAVIVNWNTRDMLAACLEALLAAGPPTLGEVIVVDNGSEDGSQEMVRTRFPDVILEANEENLGFGAAANIGIHAARGEAILVLNSDILMTEGALTTLVETLEAEPDAGLIACALALPDGSAWARPRRFPSLLAIVARNLFLERLTRGRSHHRIDGDRPVPVDWVPGACFVAWRDTLLEVGSFDESFFLYCEDVDLCRRLHATGRRVLFHPGVSITHDANYCTRTRPEVNPRVRIEGHRSLLIYARKHLGLPAVWLVRASIVAHALMRLCKVAFEVIAHPSLREQSLAKARWLCRLLIL
jgi:GT2 family glycosyltransferase